MKKAFALLLAVLMLFTLVACDKADPKTTKAPPESEVVDPSSKETVSETTKLEEFKAKGYKMAYIYNGVPTDIFQMAFNGAIETGKAVGMEVNIFTCDNDHVKFQETALNCANQDYDAIFLSHGGPEYSLDLVKKIKEKGIEVVTFDTQLKDDSGTVVEVEGVTTMFQNDQLMADQLLGYICNTLYPEKVAAGEKVNILKIWRGPGISPFDRRQETYVKYEEDGLINTLETIGPIDTANAEASMTAVTASTLTKYKEGEIDAIWSCYDAYARGSFVALMDAGINTIPLVSVDISNQDIQFMLQGINGKPVWLACSAVHFTTVGEQATRLAIMKLAGDPTPSIYNLTPSLVTYDQLTEGATVLNLGEFVDGYGVNNDNVPDWAKEALLGG